MNEIVIGGKKWTYDETRLLGAPGGFGAVFLGADEHGNLVAVKRLHLSAEEHAGREMQIAEYLTGHEHPHVIPIYAAGKDEITGHYFIVMAKAEKSLHDLIAESSPLPEQDVIGILAAIATGLAEIGELIHRDLKPANLLLHNGIWKLADLGLARFVEAATGSNSMKDFLSAPYAAPEQWRGERASKATDVYALGCILYALVTRRPPFSGPDQPDYSEQHQFLNPPDLPNVSPGLRLLAVTCLAKPPEGRPSVESVRAQIDLMRSPRLLSPAEALADAAAAVAERESRQEAERLQRRRVEDNRHAVAGEACKQLAHMFDELFRAVLSRAPNAKRLPAEDQPSPKMLKGMFERKGLVLGEAWLIVDIPYPYLQPGALATGWDMLVGGVIQVVPSYTPADIQRSANLWFGNTGTGTSYRWWEAGYMLTTDAFQWHLSKRSDHAVAPFAVEEPNQCLGGARYGLESLIADYQLAYNPRPIDGEHFNDWCGRWTHWFAKLALGKLTPPTRLPEEPIV